MKFINNSVNSVTYHFPLFLETVSWRPSNQITWSWKVFVAENKTVIQSIPSQLQRPEQKVVKLPIHPHPPPGGGSSYCRNLKTEQIPNQRQLSTTKLTLLLLQKGPLSIDPPLFLGKYGWRTDKNNFIHFNFLWFDCINFILFSRLRQPNPRSCDELGANTNKC